MAKQQQTDETPAKSDGPTDQQRARAIEAVFLKHHGHEIADTLAKIVADDAKEAGQRASADTADTGGAGDVS